MVYNARTWTAGETVDDTKMNTIRDSLEAIKRVYYVRRIFGKTTACATGDGKAEFELPAKFNGMNLVEVAGYTDGGAGVTGLMEVQIHNLTDGVDMLTTKLSHDSGEKSSRSAASQAVIDTSHDDVATGDVLRVDFDTIHSTPATGYVLTLGFDPPTTP